MKKSALIAGGIAFLFSTGSATIVSPLCVPCLTLLLGLLAGYLTGIFDKPVDQNRAVKTGTLAGLLSGIGLLLGQIIGAVVNGMLVGPEGTARMLLRMGVPAGGPNQIADIYWTALAISTACLLVFDAALMSGFGALGGLLWWKTTGNKQGTIEII